MRAHKFIVWQHHVLVDDPAPVVGGTSVIVCDGSSSRSFPLAVADFSGCLSSGSGMVFTKSFSCFKSRVDFHNVFALASVYVLAVSMRRTLQFVSNIPPD